MSRRILQIIPAEPGWHVVYEAGALPPDTPGIEEAAGVAFVPVACWALVEDANKRATVIPLSGGGSSIALVLNDPEHAQALGISPPGRRPVDWAGKVAPEPEPQPDPAPKPKTPPSPAAITRKLRSDVVERPPEPKPEPKPKPAPKPEPEPAPIEPTSVEAATAPGITMDELLSPSADAPKPEGGPSGIPGGDVFDF